jgi:DNA mismatch repair protein MutS2
MTSLDELEFPKVLDRVAALCMTEMAREVVYDLRPYTDAAALRMRHAAVQEALDLLARDEQIPYERLGDVIPLLQRSRIAGNFLAASDLLSVQEALHTSRMVKRFLTERAESMPALAAFASRLADERLIEKHITDAIDDSGVVRDTASKDLQHIRREIHDTEQRLRSRLQRILKKFGEEELLQEEFVTQRDGRFVLPLRAENKRAVDGIIHGVSQTGQTVFLEPAETYEMNNELSLLRNRELREIARILTTLTAEVGSISEVVQWSVETLIDLDVVIASARYALEYACIRPTIVDDESIELINARHPVLLQNARQTRIDVIPLTVRFDANARGILISGPNAGGKTVAMKTIGLCIAMAISGLFPPGMCTTGIRRIFSAIGDHQSIDSNLSTFSSQIIRIRDILSECGRDALVLIDEICAGTDPAEGGALAAGILDSLLERGACFVVTTHQSSLKQYALTRPAIANASLAFDDEKLQPTFHFLQGVPGNSYAFVLAANVGLPDIVLQRGRGYLGERHDELEQSITAMQEFRREAEELKRLAAQEAAKAETLRKDYEQRVTQFKEKRQSLLQDAREEASDVLRKAQALIENTVREVRESQRSASEVKKQYEQEKDALLRPETEPAPAADKQRAEVKVGDVVAVRDTSSTGTVLEIDAKRTTARVDVNGITFSFPLDLLDVRSAPSPVKSPQRSPDSFIAFDAHTSLDLRGKRADEAWRELEQFLSDAIVSNMPFVTIIHGKGTGALRQVTQDVLKEHPHIAEVRPGTLPEGGDGVTIVTFRA